MKELTKMPYSKNNNKHTIPEAICQAKHNKSSGVMIFSGSQKPESSLPIEYNDCELVPAEVSTDVAFDCLEIEFQEM